MFLNKICDLFQANGVPYALVGGHAVALHGAIRGTLDLDFIVNMSEEVFETIAKSLKSIGLISRIPISPTELFQNRNHYIQEKHLIAWNFSNPNDPSQQVDIIITLDLNDIETDKIHANGKEIMIISLTDLIHMKRESGRVQDLEDVKALQSMQ